LYQNPLIKEKVTNDGVLVASLSMDLMNNLLKLQTQDNTYYPVRFKTLQELIGKARVLAAEMGCQLAAYRMDHSVQLGDPFNPKTMEDADDQVDDNWRNARVCAIIEKGWIRKGDEDLPDHWLCKKKKTKVFSVYDVTGIKGTVQAWVNCRV
jgi:hypothetical protein